MQNIVVGITGASGAIYARQLLDKLVASTSVKRIGVALSSNAQAVADLELGGYDFGNKALEIYSNQDFNAPFASGSSNFSGMVIIPCSMGALGRIAHGISNDLITRSADVMLKERRKLILVPRESPYNLLHIRNMELITLAGGIICPASPSYYSKPESLESLVATVVDRVIHLLGIPHNSYEWGSQKHDN